MRVAICPGSFDPVTNGHIDIFERASKLFDELIIGVFHNPNKKPLFSMEERVEMLRSTTSHISNIKVDGFSGLLSDYVHKQGANIVVRGLRAFSDFEYEFQRALMLKAIDSEIETVFIMTSSEYSYLSSTGIKELARFGGSISAFVPASIEDLVIKRFADAE